MVSLHVGTLYDGNTVRVSSHGEYLGDTVRVSSHGESLGDSVRVSSHVRYTFRYRRSKGLLTRMVLLAMVKQHWSPHVYGAHHDGDIVTVSSHAVTQYLSSVTQTLHGTRHDDDTVMVARCHRIPVLGHAHTARCTLR